MNAAARTDLASLLQRFFADYLTAQRNLSAHTRHSYRDTFRLLLVFLARHHRRPLDELTLHAISPEAVLAFLAHLERDRSNSPRSRNVRLAAVRTFVHFVLGQPDALDFLGAAQRILAIPQKKSVHALLGFMTRQEVSAVIAAVDQTTKSGRRDFLLFTFLYNTGARISEALQLQPCDLRERVVQLHGKGRKSRAVPLWLTTARLLRQWIKANQIGSEQWVFTNRLATPLTQDGVAFRLRLAVRKAALQMPSLAGRRITCHTFRHSCAMALLQSGVALEVIALWLGHAKPLTTHGYIEANLQMKTDCLRSLDEPNVTAIRRRNEPSRLLAFLRAL